MLRAIPYRTDNYVEYKVMTHFWRKKVCNYYQLKIYPRHRIPIQVSFC